MVLIALATGVVLVAAVGGCSGKLTGESTLLRGLDERLKRDDVVLADRYDCSCFEVALLKAQGVDPEIRQNVGRTVDFRRDRRLGKDDHLADRSRPQGASWMDVLRCKSPEMVRKELWGRLLISNLIRG